MRVDCSAEQCIGMILKRRSYRGDYRPDPVPREHLKAIMEAGLV